MARRSAYVASRNAHGAGPGKGSTRDGTGSALLRTSGRFMGGTPGVLEGEGGAAVAPFSAGRAKSMSAWLRVNQEGSCTLRRRPCAERV